MEYADGRSAPPQIPAARGFAHEIDRDGRRAHYIYRSERLVLGQWWDGRNRSERVGGRHSSLSERSCAWRTLARGHKQFRQVNFASLLFLPSSSFMIHIHYSLRHPLPDPASMSAPFHPHLYCSFLLPDYAPNVCQKFTGQSICSMSELP